MPVPSLAVALGATAAAAGVAALARAVRALSSSGAVAATIVGTLTMAAGWRWGVVLVAFFLTSTSLSFMGSAAKARITGGRIEKAGPRDGWQVFANGGVFAAGAILSALEPRFPFAVAALGALATANGDTWATEIGTLAGRAPRSVLSWTRVAPGTSGAVSFPGTIAGLAGVLVVTGTALALELERGAAGAVIIGGTLGFLSDSMLGATLQSQRWCERCKQPTELTRHVCGEATVHIRGLRWMTNDAVNLLATLVGALTAAIVR